MPFKYNPGDRIGPYNILFLERTERKGKNKAWYGLFQCPICGDSFESQLANIQSGQSKRCKKCYGQKIIYNPGDKIGYWTVLKEDKECSKKYKMTYYLCQCECGAIKSITGTSLKTGQSKSCGCKNLKYPKDLSGLRIKEWDILYPIDSNIKKTDTIQENQNYLCRCSCGKEEIISRNVLVTNRKKNCGHKYNLIGKKFGRLTVLAKDESNLQNCTKWICQCDCGKRTSVATTVLLSGKTVSCGCYRNERIKESNCKDITGQKFGKLTALHNLWIMSKNKQGYVWHFKCDCGNEKDIPLSKVLSGQTSSCGCYLKSKGEYRVEEILINLSILYENQKSFNDCVNPKTGGKLYFDFYLPNYNCSIEYDGEQHYRDKQHKMWNGTKESFAIRRYRDNIKNQYCKEHNIKLIRIPYWDYNKLNEEYIQKALQCPLMDLSKTF